MVRQRLVLGAVQDGLTDGRVAGPGPIEVVVPEVLDVRDGALTRAGSAFAPSGTTHVWDPPQLPGWLAELRERRHVVVLEGSVRVPPGHPTR